MRKSLLVSAVAAALTVAVFAASSGTQKAVTVGDFAVKVSRVMGINSPDQKAAVSSLKKLGVNVGNDLNADLTEAQAARILGDLGLKITTSHPDSSVSITKADQLASLTTAATLRSTVPADTQLPTQCLQLANRGACNTCCITALTALGIDAANLPICAKFCNQVVPPGQQSQSEPQP